MLVVEQGLRGRAKHQNSLCTPNFGTQSLYRKVMFLPLLCVVAYFQAEMCTIGQVFLFSVLLWLDICAVRSFLVLLVRLCIRHADMFVGAACSDMQVMTGFGSKVSHSSGLTAAVSAAGQTAVSYSHLELLTPRTLIEPACSVVTTLRYAYHILSNIFSSNTTAPMPR